VSTDSTQAYNRNRTIKPAGQSAASTRGGRSRTLHRARDARERACSSCSHLVWRILFSHAFVVLGWSPFLMIACPSWRTLTRVSPESGRAMCCCCTCEHRGEDTQVRLSPEQRIHISCAHASTDSAKKHRYFYVKYASTYAVSSSAYGER